MILFLPAAAAAAAAATYLILCSTDFLVSRAEIFRGYELNRRLELSAPEHFFGAAPPTFNVSVVERLSSGATLVPGIEVIHSRNKTISENKKK